MLKKISPIIFALVVLLIQSSFAINFPNVYIALHIVLAICLVLSFEKISLWYIFFIGLISDLLMFRILGFTVIVALITMLLTKAFYSFFSFGGIWGKIFLIIVVLTLGIVFESLLFMIFNQKTLYWDELLGSVLVNLVLSAIMMWIISLIKQVFPPNENV
jgi:cell shape-determining protein MreD